MEKYPILFTRHELIEGNGFVARVTVNGRLLLTNEDGEAWVEGVNPGGIAARGDSPGEALADFSSEFRVVLFDIADVAPDFEAFKAEVEQFFNGASRTVAEEWEQAVKAVRAGEVDTDWLIKRPAESPIGIQVVPIQQPRAANNEEGEAAIAA